MDELRVSERPIAIDRILGVLGGLVVSQKDGRWVSGEGLMRDWDRSWLRAAQYLTG